MDDVTTMYAREQALESASAEAAVRTDDADAGFVSEFRPLAHRRRFVRSASERTEMETALPVAGALAASERASRTVATDALGVSDTADERRSAARELGRLSDQVVQAREALATERARASELERGAELAQQRLLAARALVQEAQRTAASASERAAELQGRCDGLQAALDQALNASIVQRWRWRRLYRRSTPGT